MSSNRCHQLIEVQLEIGHKATPRSKPTPEGYTHDWHVFVKGPQQCNVQHFVEKIVFHLHESFQKPKRVIKEPPYEVSESGYAGFELPIDVYFRNKEEPKKISFEYDLYLKVNDSVNSTRLEKLTFQNPSIEFKKKLLKSGGVCYDKTTNAASGDEKQSSHGSSQSSHGASKSSKSNHESSGDSKKSKNVGLIPSKEKSLFTHNSSSPFSSSTGALPTTCATMHDKTHSSSSQPPFSNQFMDLFGPPIKARPSPDYLKSKEASKNPAITSSAVKSSKYPNESQSSGHNVSAESERENKEKKHKSSKSSKEREKFKEKDRTDESRIKEEKKRGEFDCRKSTIKSEAKSRKHETPSPMSSEINELDKKSGGEKSTSLSKKRRRSTSSTSSFTSNSQSDKKDQIKDQSKLSSSKESDQKKESKKQKSSKEPTATTAGPTGSTVGTNSLTSSSSHKVKDVKKETSTSTTISFSNNNTTGTTTLEIKSVKKTWDSEFKKLKNKEFKADDGGKPIKENIPAATSTNTNKDTKDTKPKLNDDLKSPPKSSKFVKVPSKEKTPKSCTPSSQREMSNSPASVVSGSYTPGGGGQVGTTGGNSTGVGGNSGGPLSSGSVPFVQIMAEMGQESLSPLSSCPASPLNFEPPSFNDKLSDQLSENEWPAFSSEAKLPNNSISASSKRKVDAIGRDKSSEKKQSEHEFKKRTNTSKNDTVCNSEVGIINGTVDTSNANIETSYLNELVVLRRRICELTDRDLLQKIVDVIEESNSYIVTKTTFDFDLLKLDKSTVRKLKICLNAG